MSKLKQSIAVQRQIPEHIRINYPAFVEFIKLYYEFLEETQAQNLEKIRDVDDTLEEFIDRFKEELAKNVPIELAADKRTLLKHIRQFYLSRGSEESFKFVFKALFGQEAELFYPSTQMLCVSDGKWQQEISVFVRITGTTPNLFPVNGKFINIITPRKTIQTFVSGVSAYNELTYEVFIERDFANEITVGSTIRFVDPGGAIYTGEIVPCPSKIRVYKPGKGFRVGQLFSLKTSIGNGCLVKITKTSADGGIEVVQPIKFGLDYVSKFYSYLSSKSIQAYEYIHPLEIGAGQSSYQQYTAAPVNGAQTFTVQYLVENGVPLLLVDVIRNNASVNVTYTATNGTNVNVSGLQAGDTVKLYGVTTKGVAPAPNNPGYNEKYSGFIDYGFASMQTYMDYDITIPVQREFIVSAFNITNQGSGYTSIPTVTISGGGGQGATAIATLGTGSTAGKVINITVTNSGSQYTSIPTVTISPPTSGVTATAQVEFIVSAFNITNQGSGYTSIPTVTISGGGGTGATAIATLGTASNLGKVINIAVTNPGSGYTSIPTVTISGGGGTGATAQVIIEPNGNALKYTRASDRFFADPSYVGDIVQQFYTDSSSGVFDDDLAIIEIDLGAVARYPGYYRTADGFISDEMHIQDGKYYQAFSYVIRVEEELRKYANIIKSLVHPSGMKMFAEYNIFNHIIVSAAVPNVFKFLQFSDTISNIGDTSYNYDSYVYSLNQQNGQIEYVPASNAGIVFTRQNKAAIFPTKNLSDATEEGLNTLNLVNSQGQTVIIINSYSELRDKGVIKPFTEVIADNYLISTGSDSANTSHTFIKNYSETYSKAVSKPVQDSISELPTTVQGTDSSGIIHNFIKNYAETHVKAYEKSHLELIPHIEAIAKAVNKPLPPESITERLTSATITDSANNSHTLIRSYDETISKSPSKPLTEVIPDNFVSVDRSDSAGTLHTFTTNYSETFANIYAKAPQETIEAQFNRTLNYVHDIIKPFIESVLPQSDITNKSVIKPIQDIFGVLEDISKLFVKNVPEELIALSDEISKLLEKVESDFVVVENADQITTKSVEKNPEDSITQLSAITNKEYSKSLEEVLVLIELYANSLQRTLADEAFAGDAISKQPELYKSSSVGIDPFEDVGIIKIPTFGSGEIRIHEMMQLIVDFIDIVRSINLFDETFSTDTRPLFAVTKDIEEPINTRPVIIDDQNKGFTLGTINEPSLIVSDIRSPTLQKPISDDVSSTSIPDVNTKATGKTIQESINTIMIGNLALNSYFSELDTETYYDMSETYQLSTTLS